METLLNDFSPGLFVMQLVILIILLFLMKKFAWKPILNSLEERETGIESALASAENARKEMQNSQSFGASTNAHRAYIKYLIEKHLDK